MKMSLNRRKKINQMLEGRAFAEGAMNPDDAPEIATAMNIAQLQRRLCKKKDGGSDGARRRLAISET